MNPRMASIRAAGAFERLENSLKNLPRVVGAKVATASAGTITALARSTFRAGENAFGDTWAPGWDGRPVTLRRTGALAYYLKYAATGTKLRASLEVPYAKFQIGKRPVFPRKGGRLPVAYVAALKATSDAVIMDELRGAR
jgi:hypothetical protein